MLSLETPLDAYRSDLRRNPGRSDFGAGDTVWLLVAHCLHRLARVPAAERGPVASSCSTALRGLLPLIESEPRDAGLTAELVSLCDGLDRVDTADGADEIARAVRAMSTRMTNAGALGLAYTTIGHLRLSVPTATEHEQGMNLSEQAYIARALGDLDGAEELYQMATAAVCETRDAEVRTRSHLGRGVVARMRGNYPAARHLFQAGLAEAQEACRDDLAALGHQALLISAAVAGDVDTALVHGWAAYRLAANDANRQVEMLINLAQLALDAGYPAAAMQAFLVVLGRTEVPHYRLAASGGAAVAGAQLGKPKLVQLLSVEVEQELTRSGMPYVSAQALNSLRTAFATLGEQTRAEELRARVRLLAKSGGFFELYHKTEPVEADEQRAAPPRRELAKPSWRVIESLEHLQPSGSERLLAATL